MNNIVEFGIKNDTITTSKVIENSISSDSKLKEIEQKIKRLMDIIGGLIGTILLIPITFGIVIAKLILVDKGPIFYVQERIGKNGKTFKIYKFRSMVINADRMLDTCLAENEDARIEYERNKKLKEDPRITTIGKFIRKTSLDEFPQFINVLKGEMSLVGPRPYLPREKDDMKNYYSYIIKEKPGLTGYWQISGRNKLSFEERLNMDFDYCENNSLKEDMKILAKTVATIIKREGAI